MEKLIKIQAVINQIEEMSLDAKYRSKFNYKDSNSLEIETYCKKWAIAIMQIIDDVEGTETYYKGNPKLEILEFKI